DPGARCSRADARIEPAPWPGRGHRHPRCMARSGRPRGGLGRLDPARGAPACLIASGGDPDPPMVGTLSGSWAAEPAGESIAVVEESPQDPVGHGTAAAGIVRAPAPGGGLYRV